MKTNRQRRGKTCVFAHCVSTIMTILFCMFFTTSAHAWWVSGSTIVNEALEDTLDEDTGKWNSIDFADGTSQTTAGGGGGATTEAELESDLTDVTNVYTNNDGVLGGMEWVNKTADYTAVAGEGVLVDTDTGAITITLPASPSVSDRVGILDEDSNANTNNITIARNGSNIMGLAEDMTISTDDAAVILLYSSDASEGWKIESVVVSGNITTLVDDDGDTKIQVEESTDEDKIRFDTAGIERMIIDASGNVGIGTNAPSATLDIESSAATLDAFEINANSLTTGYLAQFYSNSVDTNSRRILSIVNDNPLAIGATSLYVRQDSTADIINIFDDTTEVFTILDGGNVGIGTTSPAQMLHILSSNTWEPNIEIENINDDINPALITFQKNSSTPANDDFVGLISFRANTDSASDFQYAQIYVQSADITNAAPKALIAITTTPGTAELAIVEGGNVGIGTTVFGTSATGELSLGLGTLGAATADIVQMAVEDNGAGNASWLLQPEAGTALRYGNNILDVESGALKIVTDSANLTFQTTTSGDILLSPAGTGVRIGSGSPSSTLDVGGDIEIGSADAFLYGDPTTDGTWKEVRDGTKLSFQKRENTAIATVASAPTAGGTGYTVNDVLTLTEGSNGTVTVTAVTGGVVDTVSLTTTGYDYTTGAGKVTTGGTGTGCTIEILTVASVYVEKGFFDASFHSDKIYVGNIELTDVGGILQTDDSPISSASYWQRIGTELSPQTAGDDVNLGTGKLLIGDGELEHETEVHQPVYLSGQTGLNDLSSSGIYSLAGNAAFQVRVQSTGTPDNFEWRKDTSGAWTGPVAMTGSAQLLQDGVSITWTATTGHSLNNEWEMAVGDMMHINEAVHIGADTIVDGDLVIEGSLRSLSPVRIAGGLKLVCEAKIETTLDTMTFTDATTGTKTLAELSSGDVVGSASSVIGSIPSFSTTTGKNIQDPNTIFIVGDNVGIGEVNPDATLDIKSLSTTENAFEVNAANMTTGYVGQFYSNSPDVNSRRVLSVINDNTLATGAKVLYVRQDSTADIVNILDDTTEVFTILDGGNVGIKRSNPEAALDINGDVKISSDFSVGNDELFIDVSNETVTVGNSVTGTDRFNVFGAGSADVQTGIASFYNSAGDIKFRIKDEWTASSIPPRLETESSLGLAFNTITDAPFVWYVNGTGNEKMRLTSEFLDINGKEATRSSSDTKQIFSPADLDAFESAGVYTMPSGHYMFMEDMTLTGRFESTDGGNVILEAVSQNVLITMSNTGTLFTSTNGSDFRLIKLEINVTGTGAQAFDIDAIVFYTNRVIINFQGSGQSIGTVTSSTAIQILNTFFLGFADGILLPSSSIISFDNVVMQSTLATANTFIDIGQISTRSDFDAMVLIGGPSESLFNIDPALVGDVDNIDIDNANNITKLSNFFKPGTVGDSTLFSDASGTDAIDLVYDSAGMAKFVLDVWPGETVVGQTVTISGFVTNPTYNGTFVITETLDGVDFEVGVSYTGSEGTGSVMIYATEVTSTAHGQLDGQTLKIRDTLYYDAGYSIFDINANTFLINVPFVATETSGQWDTGSLTQVDPNVLITNSGTQADSATSAQITLVNNTLETDIPAVNALVMIAATPDFTGTTEERIFVTTEGEAIYRGINPATLKIDGNITMGHVGAGLKNLEATFFRQDAERTTVTFTNGTNLINETGTSLVDGDTITFNSNVGTLPAELREDIVYYVISQLTNSFQVSYTLGGSAITFTDDGNGTNTYTTGELNGSTPAMPVAVADPKTVVPQALTIADTGDILFPVISNKDDAVNIIISKSYYRVFK